MRAVWQTGTGGTDVLAVRETPDPSPGPGEVRIRVAAAGLNFAEVMARQGLYPDAPKPPCVLGYEVAGVVDAVGSGVEPGAAGGGAVGFAPGDRVVALTRFGGHADTVCVPAGQALPVPDGLELEAAAAIPVTYITAYHMLFRVANLRPGERVLVHMAAGGVGTAALQLCRTVDGVVTFGTASAGKHDALREEGCDHPIDYRSEEYAARVRALTNGEGVDIVLDPLGGADWRTGAGLLRPVGRLVAYGFANLAKGERRSLLRLVGQGLRIPRFTPVGLMNRNLSVSGVNIGHLWDRVDLIREELDEVLALWQRGAVRPRIDRVFPFAEAAAAHRRITERRNIGKVLLVPGGVIAAFAPIWALTALGYVARRVHILEGRPADLLGRFVFLVAMPAALFLTLSRTPLSGIVGTSLIAFAASTIIAMGAGWLGAAVFFHRKPAERAIWAMSSGYVNAANLGIPVALQIIGDASFLATVILLQTMLIAPVVLATLDRGSDADGRLRLRRVLTLPLRNPVLLGPASGLIASAVGYRPTGVVLAVLTLLSVAAVPAALLVLGASLHPADEAPAERLGGGLTLVVALKLIAQPLLAYVAAAWVLDLPQPQVLAVVVCAGLPAAQNTFIFASQYRIGEAMAGRAVLATTTLSLVTLAVVAALVGR